MLGLSVSCSVIRCPYCAIACITGDEIILDFTLKALAAPDPFAVSLELEQDVVQALAWQGAREPWDIMQQRENILERIEAQAQALLKSGERDKWFSNASEDTKRLTATVNGPLFEQLIKEAGHPDVKCADLFREGKLVCVRLVSVSVFFACCTRSRLVWRAIIRCGC